MHNKSVQTSVQETPNRKERTSKEDTMNINAIQLNNVKIPNGTEQQIPFEKNKVLNSTSNTNNNENTIEFKNNFEGGKIKPKEARTLIGRLFNGIKDFAKLENPNLTYFSNDRDWGNNLNFLA